LLEKTQSVADTEMLGKLFKRLFWWLLVRGWLPDWILRWRIRKSIWSDLVMKMEAEVNDYSARVDTEDKFVQELKAMPIAIHQNDANQQHYEVPNEFFKVILGPKLKYSSCIFEKADTTLTQAEEDMLDLYISRAGITDGQDILDLGCGWGSVALHVAAKFPNSRVKALSNSSTQKEFIDSTARERGIANLEVITGDVAVFDQEDFKESFDVVITIEMFEHMKNYQKLLEKVASWMKKPGGKLFIHILTHRWKSYHFTKDDWMGRNFFTGGTMPSHNLLLNFQDNFSIKRHWGVSGKDYARTLDSWLAKMDAHQELLEPLFKATYGEDKWQKWWLNWRMFFIVCSETFGIKNGSEWGVSHYLFQVKH